MDILIYHDGYSLWIYPIQSLVTMDIHYGYSIWIFTMMDIHYGYDHYRYIRKMVT